MKKFSSTELKFVKNLLFTVVLGGFIGFLNYLFNIFVARYTTEEVFNVFSAGMGIVYLLQIPVLSLQNVITKKVGEEKGLDIKIFKAKNFIIFTTLGIVFSLLFYFFRENISNIASIPISTTFSLSLVLLFAFIAPLSKGILLGREKIPFVNIVLLIEALAKFAIGYIAIKMDQDINLLILATAVPSVISSLVILPFLKSEKKVEKKISTSLNYKSLLLMTVSFLLLSAPYTLDLILVNPSFRAEYSALTLIGKVVYFGCITISSVMFARLVNQRSRKQEVKTLSLSLLLTVLMGLGGSFIIFLLKDVVADIVFDGKYLGIGNFVTLYSVCMTAYAVVYMIINYLMAQGSYFFVFSLIFTTTLQIFLFERFNTGIELVVRNQVVLYAVLLALTCFNLVIYLRKDMKKT